MSFAFDLSSPASSASRGPPLGAAFAVFLPPPPQQQSAAAAPPTHAAAMSDTGSDDDESLQPQRTQAPGGHPEEEDEFEFEQNFTDTKGPLKKTLDKPFDEVHEVSDSNDDSLASPSTSPTAKPGRQQQQQQQHQQSFSQEDEEDMSNMSDMSSPPPKKSIKKGGAPPPQPQKSAQDSPQKAGSSEEEESEEEDDDDDEEEVEDPEADGAGKPSQASLYNPADYAHLVVSAEIKGLFEYIGRHKHTDIELETKMKPFIPDYIPAVGEIDAFLKVPPPEGADAKTAALGLVVLDEPAAHQSDPTVLELSLRAVNKQVISKHATVGTIEHADKNQARVVKWIQSIEDVHRKKPPPHVHYSRAMPDIEQLMQVWPPEFEELLKSSEFQLPDMNNLDCDVATFAKMVCAIMDIPVYDKVTESLHVLFTLYSEFQNHAYFQH